MATTTWKRLPVPQRPGGRQLTLADSVVLVTGGASGIGRGLVEALHARGARVAIGDVDVERAKAVAAALGSDRALAVAVDVTDAASCDAMVGVVLARFGRLDVVVANAGLPPPPGTLLSSDPAAFDRVLDVNLHGVVHTVRSALPSVVAARGHVLLIGSIYVAFNGMLATPYAMSKAAVEQLGRALRVELAEHGVTVGIAYPGFIDTGLVDRAFSAPGVAAVRRALPAFVSRPVPVERLVPELVRGIERRKPAVRFPRWVTPFLAARGVLGPASDATLRRHPLVRRGVREAERWTSGNGAAADRSPDRQASLPA